MSIRKGGKILATGGSSVKDQNNKQVLKFWSGTIAEYDALGNWDEDTLYNITDDDTHEVIDVATVDKAGLVQPDGTTILINEGVISAAIPEIDTSNLATKDELFSGSYNDLTDIPELPKATADSLGVVTVDNQSIRVDENGILQAIPPTNISTFTNDAGYLTTSQVYTKTEIDSKLSGIETILDNILGA